MVINILFLLIPVFAIASSSSTNISFISIQFFNFAIFLGILLYIIYKKVPGFLEEKQSQFLLDKKKANEKEMKNRQIYESLTKDVKALNKKQKNIEKNVTSALKNQEVKWKEQLVRQSEILKQELNREINRKKVQQIHLLKNKILNLSLKAAKAQFTMQTLKQTTNKLEQHIIKQLEKI